MGVLERYRNKISKAKTKEDKQNYMMDMRLYAAGRLANRYLYHNITDLITDELIKESLDVIKSVETRKHQKKAARIILNLKYGVIKVNNMIEDYAVVINRNDPLVRRWHKKVLERDKVCQDCGSEIDLETHHISHWADDPVNRVNVENGITLCKPCHIERHPELENLMLAKKGAKK